MAAMAAILDIRLERFLLYLILPSFKPVGLSVQEKKRKIDFQNGSHLGFPLGTILAIFDLQVIPMLPPKFQVNLPFGSEEEAKKKVKMAWISDRNNFSYFLFISHPDAAYKV